MSTLWDFVNSINLNKKDLMSGSENDTLAEKEYPAFVVNRALSQHVDTILYANEMNLNSHIDNKLQYDYLLNSIRPKKRYSKWAKKDENPQIQSLMQYYKCNYRRAQEYIQLLSPEIIETINNKLIRGGAT